MDPKYIGIFAALGSAASWAAGSFLFKRLGEQVSPFGMTLVKGAISVVLLGAILFLTGYETITVNAALLLCGSGILGIAVADTLFFAALQELGPVALVVFFMMGQMLTAFLAIFFLGEIPTLEAWAGIILTLAGTSVVLWKKIGAEDEARRSGIRGIIIGSLSMICMSISTVIAKPALVDSSTLLATLIRMLSGTLCIFFLGMATRQLRSWVTPLREKRLMVRFVFSVSVITFGGFWLSLVAIKYVDVAVASTLGATEPLFVIPLALIIFKERISALEIVGTTVAAAGVFLLIM